MGVSVIRQIRACPRHPTGAEQRRDVRVRDDEPRHARASQVPCLGPEVPVLCMQGHLDAAAASVISPRIIRLKLVEPNHMIIINQNQIL